MYSRRFWSPWRQPSSVGSIWSSQPAAFENSPEASRTTQLPPERASTRISVAHVGGHEPAFEAGPGRDGLPHLLGRAGNLDLDPNDTGVGIVLGGHASSSESGVCGRG